LTISLLVADVVVSNLAAFFLFPAWKTNGNPLSSRGTGV
jgi:hypothetical protein